MRTESMSVGPLLLSSLLKLTDEPVLTADTTSTASSSMVRARPQSGSSKSSSARKASSSCSCAEAGIQSTRGLVWSMTVCPESMGMSSLLLSPLLQLIDKPVLATPASSSSMVRAKSTSTSPSQSSCSGSGS